MKYMGSKKRIAKEILPIILSERRASQWYVEPFVGGGNIIENVSGNRIGADSNKYLIECLKLMQENPGAFPRDSKTADEVEYKNMRKGVGVSDALRGYYGFALSYGGKWFGGWRRDKVGRRDYVNESYRAAIKQSEKIQGVKFICSKYDNLNIPSGSIIYCDPPYRGTTKYKDSFDHDAFWGWCRMMSDAGHSVFVSEYSAPGDFLCLWQKSICSSLTKATGSRVGAEKLFKYKPTADRPAKQDEE